MSGPHESTVAFYDANAAKYADFSTAGDDPRVDRFVETVGAGAFVLDLGCGLGDASARMVAAGLEVDAVDASAEMLAFALERFGLKGRQAVFDDLDAVAAYDGVWANFSLLHAPRSAFPKHLAAIARALKPGGHLHIALKLGEGEQIDSLGRHYVYYGEDELVSYLTQAGFDVLERSHGESMGMEGIEEPWIAIFSRLMR